MDQSNTNIPHYVTDAKVDFLSTNDDTHSEFILASVLGYPNIVAFALTPSLVPGLLPHAKGCYSIMTF